MIHELKWDSVFFGRKIGALKAPSSDRSALGDVLKKAKKDGFAYLTCKLPAQDTGLIRHLESNGFYLTDIGVTLAADTEVFAAKHAENETMTDRIPLHPPLAKGGRGDFKIRIATLQDIPAIQKYITSLFPESRFYHDPFFSKEDADRLYQAWIENSVRGEAADIVFHVPGTGLISCGKAGKSSGRIILVGIRKRSRGKGYGTALMAEALDWFRKERIRTVTVRTQLKNIRALNFYLHTGFMVKQYDIMFGRIV